MEKLIKKSHQKDEKYYLNALYDRNTPSSSKNLQKPKTEKE